jgi:hypothetical protein
VPSSAFEDGGNCSFAVKSVSEAAETLWWFVRKLAEAMGDDAPSKLALRLPIGETFLREANGTRGAFMPR